MSYFGVSNPELNDPFYSIQAGHSRRKNAQRKRFFHGLGNRSGNGNGGGFVSFTSEEIRAEYLTYLKTNGTQGISKSEARSGLVYLGLSHSMANGILNNVETTWRTEEKRGYDSIQKVLDAYVAGFLAQSTAVAILVNGFQKSETFATNALQNALNEAASNVYTPTNMPNDYVAGLYRVNAVYNSTSEIYVVTLLKSGVIMEQGTFPKGSGNLAIEAHKSASKKAERLHETDTFQPLVDYQQYYTIHLKVDNRLYSVQVERNVSNPNYSAGVVVKSYLSTNNYNQAKATFEEEVDLISSQPTFYDWGMLDDSNDNLDNNGEGGDATGDSTNGDNDAAYASPDAVIEAYNLSLISYLEAINILTNQFGWSETDAIEAIPSGETIFVPENNTYTPEMQAQMEQSQEKGGTNSAIILLGGALLVGAGVVLLTRGRYNE